MCVFKLCCYGCSTKQEHHSKYARMRRKFIPRIEEVIKSTKVNWNMVKELGLDKPNIRKRV